MSKTLFFLVMVSLTIFSSCTSSEFEANLSDVENISTIEAKDNSSDEGIVEFTIDNQNTKVNENDALLLTNNSANAISNHWDFGNGETSSEVNPTYFYDMHGVYTITLVITDKYGDTKETSHDITVLCNFEGEDHSVN